MSQLQDPSYVLYHHFARSFIHEESRGKPKLLKIETGSADSVEFIVGKDETSITSFRSAKVRPHGIVPFTKRSFNIPEESDRTV